MSTHHTPNTTETAANANAWRHPGLMLGLYVLGCAIVMAALGFLPQAAAFVVLGAAGIALFRHKVRANALQGHGKAPEPAENRFHAWMWFAGNIALFGTMLAVMQLMFGRYTDAAVVAVITIGAVMATRPLVTRFEQHLERRYAPRPAEVPAAKDHQ